MTGTGVLERPGILNGGNVSFPTAPARECLSNLTATISSLHEHLYGVLSRDNYNIGFSSSYGKPLETIGYEVIMPDPVETFLVGTDFTYFWNNIENRFEAVAGEKEDENTYAFLWRIGVNFLDEDRLKLEFQPVYRNLGG